MKIKIEVEMDTASQDDVEIIEQLVELINELKRQINNEES